MCVNINRWNQSCRIGVCLLAKSRPKMRSPADFSKMSVQEKKKKKKSRDDDDPFFVINVNKVVKTC